MSLFKFPLIVLEEALDSRSDWAYQCFMLAETAAISHSY